MSGTARLRIARTALAALCAAAVLGACRIEKTGESPFAQTEVTTPEAFAAEVFTDRALPFLSENAGALTASATGPVLFTGAVVSVDVESRAGRIGIDVDGDGRADASVQVGPVIQGAALRDALTFVSFNDFSNQVEYARFGRALNAHVLEGDLAALDRSTLQGQRVEVLGVAETEDGAPRITPARIRVVSGS